MERLIFASTFLATLGAGLMAGLFFAFSVSVMAALDRLPPAGGISAMQSINVVIVNPVFLLVFFGTAALSILLAIVALVRLSGPGAFYLLAGSVIYLIGSIVVTMVFNVPLNNALAAVKPDSAEGESLWRRYVSVWTAWNHTRTVACLAACASFILALH